MGENLIIEASAGSGKTYALAERYLELLSHIFDEQENIAIEKIGNIVAITFTNKAAIEMRERILNFLINLSGFKNSIHYQLNLPKKNALKLLINIIQNYSDFNIITIDSFINRLMRAFAVDLNITPDYDITFDKEEIVDLAMNELFEDIKLKDELINFIKIRLALGDRGIDGLQIIYKAISSFDFFSFRAGDYPLIEKSELLEYCKNSCKKTLRGSINTILKEIEQSVETNLKKLNALTIEEQDKINKNRGRFLFKEAFDIAYLDKFNKVCKEGLTFLLKKNKIIDEKKEIKVRELSCKIFKLLRFYQVYSTLENSSSILNVYKYFLKKKRQIEKQLNIVEGDEIALEVLRVLLRGNGVTYAFVQLGEKIQHYLIDEFQDTSKEQFEAIYPLIENAISSKGSLFVVGDKKQAIYGWRGGDYRIFDELEKRLPDKKKKALKNNYRSTTNIIKFNNKIFDPKNMLSDNVTEKLKEEIITELKKEIIKIYKEVEQNPTTSKEGFIKVVLKKTDDKDEFYKKKLIEILKDIIKNGVKPHQIMILLRRKDDIKKVVYWIHEELENIDTITEDSLIITKNPEIKNLLLLASAILFRNEAIYKKAAIELIDNINDEKFEELKDKLGDMPLYEIIVGLLKELNIDYKKNEAYITALLEEVLNRHYEGKTDWEIIESLYDNPTAVAISENTNAIKISTIHKAKGLQSHTVIIPFYDWILYDSKKSSFDFVNLKELGLKRKFMFANLSYIKNALKEAKKLTSHKIISNFIEALNLMYVANTRAEKNLFILGAYKLTSENKIPKNITAAHLLKNSIENAFEENINIKGDIFTYRNGSLYNKEEQNYLSGKKIEINYNPNTNIEKRLKILEQNFIENKTDILTGSLFHTAISYITKISEKDNLDTIINDAYNKATKAVGYENKIVKNMMRKAIDNLSEYFFKIEECFNEKEFVDNNGNILRPDRIVLRKGKITIIEYKTGNAEKEHKEQLKTYLKLFNNAQGLIYYCKDGTIVWL